MDARNAVNRYYRRSIETGFGRIVLLWLDRKKSPIIERVLLPAEHDTELSLIGGAESRSCREVDKIACDIERMFRGEAVEFDLRAIDLDTCAPFQKRVLLAESAIPRGWVSTYGRIARQIGKPKGARAVGNALAKNPFPLIIPCHRAVRADGRIGGFRGGIKMKKLLLSLEGVEMDENSRVRFSRVYY